MKKLPLVIDTELFIQSVDHKLTTVKSKILGARRGDFIIIETPVLHFSDRLFSRLTGAIRCSFTVEGEACNFLSTVLKHTEEGFCLIEYPRTFEITALRSHPRIRVNIETRMDIGPQRETLTATMVDISAGGCRLTVPYLLGVTVNTPCVLSFILPDNQEVEHLEGTICSLRTRKLRKSTEIGIKFFEPTSELEKIATFCGFCSFFEA
jgi:c-di-GMP-binding flagellar brake protein YcgR